MTQEDDEKPHDPSQKRLEEARKRGDIVRSAEATAAAALAGVLLAVLLFGQGILAGLGHLLLPMIAQADRLAPQYLAGSGAIGPMLLNLAKILASLFLLPALACLLALLAQRAIVFAPSKLAPNWGRLSPLAGFRQKFGADGLVDFARNTLKATIIGVLMVTKARAALPEILSGLSTDPKQGIGLMLRLASQFLVLIVAISAVFAGADYLWQWLRHLRRNRMSRQDLTDEMKDSEGDPHIRQQRRYRAREIATNRMLQDVSKADVIVVNPTHYAVALRWNRASRGAPICVAKGQDDLAARIRERAMAAGVPIHPDPPTARAIHATVEIGRPIRPEHYRAVAAAIRFAEAMRKRSKGLKA